jgi:hypothetical protein
MSAVVMNTNMPNVPKEPIVVAADPQSTAVLGQVGQTLQTVSQQLESQSLTALTQGFFFAAALSWMDVSRWVIGQFVKGNKNGGIPLTLTATATTLLSILVFIIVSTLSPKVKKPGQPMYAVVGR